MVQCFYTIYILYCSYIFPCLLVNPPASEELERKIGDIENRWRDSVDRCEKLKQAYGKLREEHINLIRSNAETKKTRKLCE